ncbi:glycosyltransferase family 39 protein [Malassezia pachydermatis]|uniref:Dolichyl-phosphate-mannose--protein mannosyltransferase n=1 Tax=Malassezia pachydermatis TaxID=77020 RepID=A0A0M8MVB3_9BASI|nr:glycosyltransferase family 39 protein [Malassezia pachydermatis]KOS15054.1 glycosyltransferase family 39 protein [Malassezia pachydermatis]
MEEKQMRSSQLTRYADAMPMHKPQMPLLDRISLWSQNDTYMLIFYTVLSVLTRLYRIGSNHKVVWDEAHFGKFGSFYIRHLFYFDVHPPLGKILVAVSGWLSGFDGNYEFDSGSDYPANVPFISMRVIMAMYGVMMVPVAFLTAQSFGWNWRTKHFFTLMVLLDNGWLTISRFILLDSMLLVFTLCVVLGLVRFHRMQDQPFTRRWWFWLFFTGVSLGCVTSVKMVGLFVMTLVGLYTVEDLWNKLGDLKMPVRTYLRHWCARIVALIFVPLCIYMLSFKLHFAILYKSGSGDAQMSSLFQSNLEGSELSNFPLEAAYGSKVTLKNMGFGGGLLHSHIQTYPEGSQEQQVTCYHYKDTNNHFIFAPLFDEPALPGPNDTVTEPPRMLKSGDVVRLVHVETSKNLRTHLVPAPVSKDYHEVSGYGNWTEGDDTAYWAVEVVDDLQLGAGKEGSPVRTLTTRLRFRNPRHNCYLRAANVVLPDWGWKQTEVTCDPANNPSDVFTHWNIENHWNDRLNMSQSTHRYRSPFLRDFVHLNVAMMVSNNALVPDNDKFDVLASKPLEWPWMWNGLRMNGWGADQDKYYLIGNPVVWWGSTASLHVAVVLLVWYILRRQRHIHDMTGRTWDDFLFGLKVGGIGWLLHYGPFLLMGRVTYIHHYLPTLYFAVIVYAHLLDHFLWNQATARYLIDWRLFLRTGRLTTGKLNPFIHDTSAPVQGRPLTTRTKNVTFAIAVALLVAVFWWFRAVSFGMYGDISEWHYLKWRKTWNIY